MSHHSKRKRMYMKTKNANPFAKSKKSPFGDSPFGKGSHVPLYKKDLPRRRRGGDNDALSGLEKQLSIPARTTSLRGQARPTSNNPFDNPFDEPSNPFDIKSLTVPAKEKPKNTQNKTIAQSTTPEKKVESNPPKQVTNPNQSQAKSPAQTKSAQSPVQKTVQKTAQKTVQKSVPKTVQKTVKKPVQKTVKKPVQKTVKKRRGGANDALSRMEKQLSIPVPKTVQPPVQSKEPEQPSTPVQPTPVPKTPSPESPNPTQSPPPTQKPPDPEPAQSESTLKALRRKPPTGRTTVRTRRRVRRVRRGRRSRVPRGKSRVRRGRPMRRRGPSLEKRMRVTRVARPRKVKELKNEVPAMSQSLPVGFKMPPPIPRLPGRKPNYRDLYDKSKIAFSKKLVDGVRGRVSMKKEKVEKKTDNHGNNTKSKPRVTGNVKRRSEDTEDDLFLYDLRFFNMRNRSAGFMDYVKESFFVFDSDGDGEIGYDFAVECIESVEHEKNEEIIKLLNSMRTQTGNVAFNFFEEMASKFFGYPYEPGEVKALLRELGPDRAGKFDLAQFKKEIKSINQKERHPLYEEDIDEILDQIAGKDGVLDFKDLCNAVGK